MAAVFSWKGSTALPLAHHYLWHGSVRHARRWFAPVVLVADAPGRRLLAEQMRLPFDEVVELPELPAALRHVYDLPKLRAHEIMAARGRPYLQIDFDAFLRRGLPPDLQAEAVICEYTYPTRAFATDLHGRLPVPLAAGNARSAASGIIGGCDLAQLAAYATASLGVGLDACNRDFLRAASGYQASVYLGEMPLGPPGTGLLPPLHGSGEQGREDYWRAGYIHFAGGLKNQRETSIHAEMQVRADFGERVWLEVRDRFDAVCREL